MFDITYAQESGKNMGVKISERPSVPAPIQDVKEYKVAGRDGVLISNLGTYEDIEIKIKFNFIVIPNDWGKQFRKIKQWLLFNQSGHLKFSDDPEVFYKVKAVFIADSERTVKESGEFTATFKCEAYQYFESGQIVHSLDEVRFNPYGESKPVYKIKGEGICNLTVNGKTLSANVGQNITVDTDRMISYRKDGTLMNTSTKGNYNDLWLKPGENQVTITNGFELEIIPNWRCI